MTDPRPRPKYGEYAPLAPDAPAHGTDAANGSQIPPVPTAEQFPVPSAASQSAGAPHTSSPPAFANAAGEAVVPERKRRIWDVFLTATLLLLGVADVINSFSTVANLGPLLREALAAQGGATFTSDDIAAEAGGVANIVRVVALVLTIVFALMQIQRRRIAFWIPLVGATIAGVALLVAIFVAVLSDPGFMAYVDSMQ
ncbi:MAG: DUF6264 family protein [Rhodoglobus sp.]